MDKISQLIKERGALEEMDQSRKWELCRVGGNLFDYCHSTSGRWEFVGKNSSVSLPCQSFWICNPASTLTLYSSSQYLKSTLCFLATWKQLQKLIRFGRAWLPKSQASTLCTDRSLHVLDFQPDPYPTSSPYPLSSARRENWPAPSHCRPSFLASIPCSFSLYSSEICYGGRPTVEKAIDSNRWRGYSGHSGFSAWF